MSRDNDQTPSHPAPPRIGALLRQAWQLVRRQIYAGVRADGYDDLSAAHIAIFRYEGLDGRRPTHLAEQMQITKQSLNSLLRHLERRDYVELRPDRTDGRARQIRLTPRGRLLDAAIRAHARRAERDLERVVGKESFRAFRQTLVRIAESATPTEDDQDTAGS
jgi:DNA-binding MarR family transcriptional regulator